MGKKQGIGMYTYPDGSKYTGLWYKNRIEGYGEQIRVDGTTY